MKKNNEFTFESLQDCESIIKYLEALSEGFKNHKIVFGAEGETFAMFPDGLLDFEISAKTKNNRSKMTITCSWKSEDHADEEGCLSIKSDK